jgi:hypothetical protein
MDISANNFKSDVDRAEPFSTVLHKVLGIVRWLNGFFTLTEEDRLKADINVGSQDRDG